MKSDNFEIERKFLIAYPDLKLLTSKSEKIILIEQTYLSGTDKDVSRRIRKSTTNNGTSYTKNEKQRLSPTKRIEIESDINEEEYKNLIKSADLRRKTLYKTRYCIPFGTHIAEIDTYKNMYDYAICEVELSSECDSFQLPNFIHVICEVTNDTRFSNSSMSLEMPII